MSDTLITIIAIALAAILMFVFPLMTMSERAVDVSQATVKAATTNFVDTARSQGKITKEAYDEFVQTITATTGNTYDVEPSIQHKDTNLGKKSSLAQPDKIGENAYYTVYKTQFEAQLDREGVYYLKEGDIISVSVKNTNQTIAQQLKNFFYTVTGNDAYTIAAEHSGIVTANGK